MTPPSLRGQLALSLLAAPMFATLTAISVAQREPLGAGIFLVLSLGHIGLAWRAMRRLKSAAR